MTMPIWYDPATRQPYIYEPSPSGFKRLVGANNFTISFQRRIPSTGFGKTAICGSKWWYPQQQTLFVLESIGENHVFGKAYRMSFSLRMPVSKATFLLEYRYVPPMVGTYWTITPNDAPPNSGTVNETLHITAVRNLTVYYKLPKARYVESRYLVRRRRAPVINLTDLLRQGYQREVPAPGDIWIDFHAEEIEIIRTTKLQVTYRNLIGGEGTCLLHDFFYLFRRPDAADMPKVEEAAPEPVDDVNPRAWSHLNH